MHACKLHADGRFAFVALFNRATALDVLCYEGSVNNGIVTGVALSSTPSPGIENQP